MASIPFDTDTDDADAWFSRNLNMTKEAFLELLDSMLYATAETVRINLDREEDVQDIIMNSLRTTLLGALIMGMRLEREFGPKVDTSEISRDK